MTVLTICSDASKQMGKPAPSSVLASTDKYALELSALINESATAIAKFHDWQKLKILKTQTGDAVTTAFDLPTDYDRMPLKAAVFRSSTTRPMNHILDNDEWLLNRLQNISNPVGEWTLLGGQMQIYPVLSATETAKYYYQSNKACLATDAVTTKATFTVDSDTFRLPERLLTLSLIWRWRAMKGLDYAEDMKNFEIAQSQEVAREKGNRILKIGHARLPDGATLAYPGTISA